MNLEKLIKKKKKLSKQWTNEDMLEFARVASGGSYGDYKGCKSLTSKLKKYKLMNEDLNKHRQVRGIDSNLHDYDRIKETIQDNKFSLCHLGESVMRLYAEEPNDTDLGKLVRELILSKYE